MKPALEREGLRVYVGDAQAVLPELPAESVHACVTSPPFFGLRSYLPGDHPDKAAEVGTEETPEAYVERMVAIFREVRRVLRSDGSCWIEIGDSYASDPAKGGSGTPTGRNGRGEGYDRRGRADPAASGLKAKDLIGVPWMLAFALRADGWWLRGVNVWDKPNGMPESVTGRFAVSHSYVLHLTKRADAYFDWWAVQEDAVGPDGRAQTGVRGGEGSAQHRDGERWPNGKKRRGRSVWRIVVGQFKAAHFAVMTPEVAERCIRAATSAHGVCADCGAPWVREVVEYEDKGHVATCKCENVWLKPAVVLDPFFGAGTTGMVALRLGKNAVGIELDGRNLETTIPRRLDEGWRLAQQSLV